jgi:hypothetical protein
MAYSLYEDEKLLKRQGGIDQNSTMSLGLETLGHGIVDMPKPFIDASKTLASMTGGDITQGIANRLSADSAAQNEAINRRNVNLALDSSKLKTDITTGNFPKRLDELPNSPVSPIGNYSKSIEKILPELDQRFQNMQSGQSGVSQDQIQSAQKQGKQFGSNGTDDLTVYPKSRQLSDNQSPTFTNNRGMLQARDQDGNLMSHQAGVDSVNQGMVRPGLREMSQDPNSSILANRQPGQSVRYNKNGLNVEFAPGTSNQEISAFTNSHKQESEITRQNNVLKDLESKKANNLAMAKAQSGIMDMPQRPNVQGMSPNERKDAIDAYQSELLYVSQANQTAMNRHNNTGQNANAAETNRINDNYHKGLVANDTTKTVADSDAKRNLMNNENSKEIRTLHALSNASPTEQRAYYLGQKEHKPNIESIDIPNDPTSPLMGFHKGLVNTDTNTMINPNQSTGKNISTFDQALSSHPAYQRQYENATPEQQAEMRKKFAGRK